MTENVKRYIMHLFSLENILFECFIMLTLIDYGYAMSTKNLIFLVGFFSVIMWNFISSINKYEIKLIPMSSNDRNNAYFRYWGIKALVWMIIIILGKIATAYLLVAVSLMLLIIIASMYRYKLRREERE